MFLDAHPSTTSPIAELVRRYPIKSKHVIAHIRKATRGKVALQNCHPFQRELWGRYWVFAHNGTLANYTAPAGEVYRAVGETDTEAAFCWMLDGLRHRYPAGKPPLDELYQALTAATEELRRHGPFNYLLSDGEHFFAHCSTALHYIVRRAPFAAAHLIDRDVTVDFSEVTTPHDRVAVIATTPLTDNERWTPIAADRLVVFQDGMPQGPA
jgi:glutamine amidotransferase